MMRPATIGRCSLPGAAILGFALSSCADSRTPTSATVTPSLAVPYAIRLIPASVSLTVGQSIVVTAVIQASNGDNVSGQAIVWGTGDSTIAKVEATGSVAAVSPGTTTLRASFRDAVAAAPVTVTKPTNETIGFVATGSMATARSRHTATLLHDGTVLIAGGSGDRLLSAELYDPATRTFTPTGDMTTARSNHTATLLPDGRVLIVGGDPLSSGQDGPSRSTAELYDPSGRNFAPTGDLVTPQLGHTATLLGNGKVLIAGGLTVACCPSSVVRAEVYDPATGEFAETGAYAGRGSLSLIEGGPVIPTATLLRNGTVLIAGEPTAELYDPNTGSFSLTGAMLTQGALGQPYYIGGRTATRLADGTVLLAGGVNEDVGRFSSAELYDPTTGAFSITGEMGAARHGHSAALLPSGKVLIAGGESVLDGCGPSSSFCRIQSLASAESYDLSQRIFTSAGRMNVQRESHTATVLDDGSVLITGGITFIGGLGVGKFSVTALASAELYLSDTGNAIGALVRRNR